MQPVPQLVGLEPGPGPAGAVATDEQHDQGHHRGDGDAHLEARVGPGRADPGGGTAGVAGPGAAPSFWPRARRRCSTCSADGAQGRSTLPNRPASPSLIASRANVWNCSMSMASPVPGTTAPGPGDPSNVARARRPSSSSDAEVVHAQSPSRSRQPVVASFCRIRRRRAPVRREGPGSRIRRRRAPWDI